MSDEAVWRTHYTHPSPWDQDYPPLSVPDMLAAAVARRGAAPLIDFMGRKFGYAETQEAAHRIAGGLARMGIQRGDRVGLFLPNVPTMSRPITAS
jgi:long-chain acyl-CoA synthetase